MAYNEKQLQIIEIAEQLFADHGYGNTSVRQIADKAGVNLAMISYYFGSKEKLMHALIEHRMGQTFLTLENVLKDEALAPLQKMNIVVSAFVEKIIQRQCFHKIMVTEHILDKNNQITGLLMTGKKRNSELLTQIIKEGQKKKIFRKNIDVPMLMSVLAGTINHALMNKAFYKEFHQLHHLNDEQLNDHLAKKLNEEIKVIFKALLTYEA